MEACDYCEKSFETSNGLRRHLLIQHQRRYMGRGRCALLISEDQLTDELTKARTSQRHKHSKRRQSGVSAGITVSVENSSESSSSCRRVYLVPADAEVVDRTSDESLPPPQPTSVIPTFTTRTEIVDLIRSFPTHTALQLVGELQKLHPEDSVATEDLELLRSAISLAIETEQALLQEMWNWMRLCVYQDPPGNIRSFDLGSLMAFMNTVLKRDP